MVLPGSARLFWPEFAKFPPHLRASARWLHTKRIPRRDAASATVATASYRPPLLDCPGPILRLDTASITLLAHAPPPDPGPLCHAAARIGVFDSGVGGLSVLRALHRHLPQAHLMYVADSAYAPYGERSEAEIIARTTQISRFLHDQGAQVLVIACNTATAAAVHHLRHAYPHWPIVGVEPGLKPARQITRNGRIGVMATSGTLRSEKFQRLMAQHGSEVFVHLQACPGLAHAIERGDLQSRELHELIERYSAALRGQGVDTVVLGCTHYPFVQEQLQAALGPDVQIIDTAEPVARHTVRLVEALGAGTPAVHCTETAPTAPSRTELWTTGDPAALAAITRAWLDFDCVTHTRPPPGLA